MAAFIIKSAENCSFGIIFAKSASNNNVKPAA